MHLIQTISNKFAQKVSAELNYDSEKQEVIAYGAFALLQMIFSIALVILFGWIFGVLIEALVISFSTSILRKYSGGVHATSAVICIIIGTVACVGFGLLANISLFSQIPILVGLVMIVFVFSFATAIKKAPVESENKPISDRRKVAMKKGTLILLGIYLLIIIGLLLGFWLSKNRIFAILAVCVSIGSAWQMFTLTKFGEIILGKIDQLLNKILTFK